MVGPKGGGASHRGPPPKYATGSTQSCSKPTRVLQWTGVGLVSLFFVTRTQTKRTRVDYITVVSSTVVVDDINTVTRLADT